MRDINEQAAEKIVELGALLLEILENEPFTAVGQTDEYFCYYCDKWDNNKTEHEDDCLYVRIRKVTGFKQNA